MKNIRKFVHDSDLFTAGSVGMLMRIVWPDLAERFYVPVVLDTAAVVQRQDRAIFSIGITIQPLCREHRDFLDWRGHECHRHASERRFYASRQRD